MLFGALRAEDESLQIVVRGRLGAVECSPAPRSFIGLATTFLTAEPFLYLRQDSLVNVRAHYERAYTSDLPPFGRPTLAPSPVAATVKSAQVDVRRGEREQLAPTKT